MEQTRSPPMNQGLRQWALDTLSVPAMSAEVERVFSQAKRLLTIDRNRLSNEMVEALSDVYGTSKSLSINDLSYRGQLSEGTEGPRGRGQGR